MISREPATAFRNLCLAAAAALASGGCAGGPETLHGGGQYVIAEGGSVKWQLNDERVEIGVHDGRLVATRDETSVALRRGVPAEFELELTSAVLALRFKDGGWFTWRDGVVTYAGQEHRLASPGTYEIDAGGRMSGPGR